MNTEIKTEYLKNKQFNPIPDSFLEKALKNPLAEFLTVSNMGYFPHSAEHYTERPAGCPTAIIMYISEGTGFFAINNKKKEALSAQQIIVIPPDTPHIYYSSADRPWSVYWLHVSGPFYEAFYNNISRHLPIRISDILGDRIKDIFWQCFRILNSPYETDEFIYLCQLVSTMFSLINCFEKPDVPITEEGNLTINKAISFMKKHIHEKISREQLLATMQVSSSHLTQMFKRSTGYAPIEYFLRLKMHAVSRDLYFSKLPIRDIAGTYGFEDPYYFSRIFKKITGMAPARFRDRANG